MVKKNSKKFINLIERQFKDGQYRKSIKTANKLIKMCPDEAYGYTYKLHSIYKLEGKEKSLEKAKEIVNKHDEWDELIFEIGEFYRSIDEYDISIIFYEKAYDLNPCVNYAIGMVYSLAEIEGYDEDDVIDFIDQFPKDDPKWLDFMFIKSDILSKEKEYKKSLKVCDMILKQDPDHLLALTKKTFLLITLKKIKKAEKVIDYRLENDINSTWALVDKGLVTVYLYGDYEKANEFISKALEADPVFQYAFLAKAVHNYEQGNLEEALKNIDKATKNKEDPLYMRYLMYKALLLKEMGETEKLLDVINQIPEDYTDSIY
ncbi:MAG: hypothetical protein LBT10_05205 [Methanobrevibacter sp.]|jgi:tetratricopeptide (TPR) repeat protein|nr:hypothetical protein [Methanobrevibacter sp.]